MNGEDGIDRAVEWMCACACMCMRVCVYFECTHSFNWYALVVICSFGSADGQLI